MNPFHRKSAILALLIAGTSRLACGYDINQAIIFTIDNKLNDKSVDPYYGIGLARHAASDVLIRAWFKWAQADPIEALKPLTAKVHEMGAIFGGGLTCSALYDGENGISRDQLLDMATRGVDGQLFNAWGRPGIRHGSLSSPAYLDYLLHWSRQQIDAGVDYLFMDEHTAALSRKEGYDAHSLSDFRDYLLKVNPRTREWTATDPRWKPDTSAALWQEFRKWRDDRAWKYLTDSIRAYAKDRGRQVLISANGLAKYVDLQVLGIWKKWTTKDGHIDVSENLLPYWHSLVEDGRAVAGKRVPVVLFHDWGMGNPPFPWLTVPAADREVWMRTRGAEIYAAGAFFAFPVFGPFGCDAGKDGTMPTIVRQTAFYRAHRDLYVNADYLGSAAPQSVTPNLSLAVWSQPGTHAVLLHVVNRNVLEGSLHPQEAVEITLPLNRPPKNVTLVSPDFPGTRSAKYRRSADGLEVAVGNLDAYTVAILRYTSDVDLRPLRNATRTAQK